MKKIIIAFAVIIVVVAADIVWNSHMSMHTQKLITLTDTAIEYLDKGMVQDAQGAVKKISEEWEHLSDHWMLVVNHDHIISVEEKLIRAEGFLSSGNSDEAYAELCVMREQLQTVSDMSMLLLRNIF